MIQAQKLNRGYPPIQGGLHLPGKRHADWPIARKAFPHVAVVPVTHAPREFRAGDLEGFESRDETPHTQSITHTRVGATQKCQNGEKIMTRKGAFLCLKIFTIWGKFALDLPRGGY